MTQFSRPLRALRVFGFLIVMICHGQASSDFGPMMELLLRTKIVCAVSAGCVGSFHLPSFTFQLFYLIKTN